MDREQRGKARGRGRGTLLLLPVLSKSHRLAGDDGADGTLQRTSCYSRPKKMPEVVVLASNVIVRIRHEAWLNPTSSNSSASDRS